MRLLYPLSEEALAALCEVDAGDVLFSIPYDLEGVRGVDGLFAVTREGAYRILDGRVAAAFTLSDFRRFYTEDRRGASALMGEGRDGAVFELCRTAAGVAPKRFAALLPSLSALAEGGEPPIIADGEPELVCHTCGRPFPKGGTVCPFCAKDKRNRRVLLEATRGLWGFLLFPVLVAAVTLAIRFTVPAIQKVAVNGFIYPAEGVARGTTEQFLVIALSLVGFDILLRVLGVLGTRLSGVAGNRFVMRLRRALFEKAEGLSLASIQRRSIGYLSDRINGDVDTISNFLINCMPSLFSGVLGLLVGVFLILAISPPMSLMVLLPLPFAILFSVLVRRRLSRLQHATMSRRQRYFQHVFDTFEGERVVKAFGQEGRAVDRYYGFNGKMTRASLRAQRNSAVLGSILTEIFQLGNYLILFFGNLWLFEGRIDAGTIMQFTAYAAIFYEPIRLFTNLPQELAAFQTSLSQVREILDEENEVKEPKEPKFPAIRGHIKVEDVTFGYNSYSPVLKDLTLEIHPGEMIGIVGHSGSGKTTLANLLLRLYDVNRGRITIDGVDLREIDGRHLRSHIGVVLQETQLFDGTIRNNIRFARQDASDEEVIAAARVAGAHDFILSLPEGYNSSVGEHGYNLSGGERQRIAIARALIHNPEILILDEATASLDTETEKNIQEALDALSTGRTTIAIAHRLSTLRNADRIFVFREGRLIEAGTHRELIARRGKYYELASSQVLLAQAEEDAGRK